MVHACASRPANVTCSVSVTGNAASESSCIYYTLYYYICYKYYIFVTRVCTQTQAAHTVHSRSVSVCGAHGVKKICQAT